MRIFVSLYRATGSVLSDSKTYITPRRTDQSSLP